MRIPCNGHRLYTSQIVMSSTLTAQFEDGHMEGVCMDF